MIGAIMKDFNEYVNKMEKSMKDKLFFIDKIDLNKYDAVEDFGCANGKMIKNLSKIFKTTLIGYDKSEQMIFEAKNISYDTSCIFTSSLNKLFSMLKNKNYAIIFSSVLHEVSDDDMNNIIKLMTKSKAVIIRDMFFDNDKNIYIEDLTFIPNKYKNDNYYEFEKKYGILNNTKNLYHYFLKYTYLTNWETEILENYFSIDYNLIVNTLKKNNFSVEYDKKYILPYKKQEIKTNFNFDLVLPTHRKLIFKRT